MTAWHAILSDEIHRQARQEVAECGLSFGGCGDVSNQNAAFSACRTAFDAPSWVLPQDEQPNGDTVEDWREWMRDRYRHKIGTGHYADRRNAAADVWSEAERVWHLRHASVFESDRCSGCGHDLYGIRRVMTLFDGAAVHLVNRCIDTYADRWRAEARAALIAMGLEPPPHE
jgi:hypothetical protein